LAFLRVEIGLGDWIATTLMDKAKLLCVKKKQCANKVFSKPEEDEDYIDLVS
jgi:hypothetical protein